MRIMLSLIGDAPFEPIDAYLGARAISRARLAGEGAIASLRGEADIAVEPAISELRAVWVLDVASRAAATELARTAPGEDGMLEVRETYTPVDFGQPEEPPPSPSPPLAPDHQRYLALVRTGAIAESGAPPLATLERMSAYCDGLGDAMQGGVGLKASAKGTRVRRRAAQRFIVDGPFAESKELVGGYLLLQARSLAEAVRMIHPWLAIHREAQQAAEAHIEVRRVVD